MPMVTRGNQHRVNVRPGEQVEEVPIGAAVLVAVMRVNQVLDLCRTAALHIAVRDELNILLRQHDAQVILASRTQADAAQRDSLARWHRPLAAQRPRRNEPRQKCGAASRQGMSKKTAPIQVLHCVSSSL